MRLKNSKRDHEHSSWTVKDPGFLRQRESTPKGGGANLSFSLHCKEIRKQPSHSANGLTFNLSGWCPPLLVQTRHSILHTDEYYYNARVKFR